MQCTASGRHDFRLMCTELDDEQREYASIISTSGNALLTVIKDILDFSKLEAGRVELEMVPFDVRQCVDDAVALIRVASSEKGLELRADIAPGTPPVIVGDVNRLRQILLNLLNNAVKFTDRGGATVAGRRVDHTALRRHVLRLAISKRLAEAMGGTISAESTGVPGEAARST